MPSLHYIICSSSLFVVYFLFMYSISFRCSQQEMGCYLLGGVGEVVGRETDNVRPETVSKLIISAVYGRRPVFLLWCCVVWILYFVWWKLIISSFLHEYTLRPWNFHLWHFPCDGVYYRPTSVKSIKLVSHLTMTLCYAYVFPRMSKILSAIQFQFGLGFLRVYVCVCVCVC